MKKCIKCNTEQDFSEFYKCNQSKDKLTTYCKKCFSKYREENRERSRKYMESRRASDNEALKHTKRKSWRNMDPRKKMLSHSMNRAKLRGLEFNLEIEDIVVPELCPLLEVPFIVGKKGDYLFTPTLDRIDSSKGYIKGNIQVICMLANSMKNCADRSQLITFSKNILKLFKEDDIVRTDEKSSEG